MAQGYGYLVLDNPPKLIDGAYANFGGGGSKCSVSTLKHCIYIIIYGFNQILIYFDLHLQTVYMEYILYYNIHTHNSYIMSMIYNIHIITYIHIQYVHRISHCDLVPSTATKSPSRRSPGLYSGDRHRRSFVDDGSL